MLINASNKTGSYNQIFITTSFSSSSSSEGFIILAIKLNNVN